MTALLAFVLLCLSAGAVRAQPQEQPLRVATRLVTPFVLEQGGELTGFSIELWREIARQLRVESKFLLKPTVQELLEAVKSQEAHLAISAISITAERENHLEFSHPMFDAGLQILVPIDGARPNVAGVLFASLFSPAAAAGLGIVLLLVLVPAHLMWFFERRSPTGMLVHRAYFPGIFEAAWWAASTLATQADQMPRAVFARVIAIFWMFSSVVLIAYFTADITSALTLQQLRGEINGPEDLPGKRVASVRGSTSADYLRRQKIEVMEFPNVEEAYGSLRRRETDAVVYDAPVLLYHAAHQGKGRVQIVGPLFRKESYGIALPNGSPQRKRVNEALLQLKENGTYDRLYQKWFGHTSS